MIEQKYIDKNCKELNIFGNKISEFDNIYVPNHSNFHPFPDNVKRNSNGSILLDDIPFIVPNEYNIKNLDDTCFSLWIMLSNGSKIFLKDRYYEYYIKELFVMYLFKLVKIKTASYDIVSFNDKSLLASNCFLNESERLIKLFEDEDFNVLSKFDEVDPCIDNYVKQLMKKNNHITFLKFMLLDYLYGNIDRLPNNFCYVENLATKTTKLAPAFDNAETCLIRKSEFYPRIISESNENSIDFAFNYILDFECIVYWLKYTVNNINISQIPQILEKEKKISMDNKIYTDFEKFIKESENYLNDELKNKGYSFKIKLT